MKAVEKLLKHLHSQGYSAVISNYCETFVCNEIYFRILFYFCNSKVPTLVSFVHLPLPKSYGKALKENGSKKTIHLANNKSNQMAAMQAVVQSIIKYNCQSLVMKMQMDSN